MSERGGSGVDEVLVALSDPTRRRLLDLLGERGEASATGLAAGLPVSRQAVVKHLGVLESAGLVVARRHGREVRYAVRPEPLDLTARWMAALAASWDRKLDAIKRRAESD
ncbi:ArsR family transcriptional regulator [Saccharopolyspora erythraea NRRL 2338]|uniref:Possible transcriptional regulator, ArsR family n=2 Tax=Saccharopolyspora erythraea TaxID=1836 RepID=A4FMQ0_SACEN|nr:metalloregulator ArsR/SmtB family transcription factor [Saccharopolyspora erythraea]EQD85939.1 ArsR family transcriptional regulator [Saccharopolyspora erythraea D]PFG98970.1 ArsR family transcriptional regulator [Saccharopolyspora erythraea NRRL 2338]QRK88946.1 winged helix-turn-helix transcriptional regulator [Saccharopolyspora erythraea]CAM05325.1 possible transcriptional regulator, ArsR family [Saccharopolyspora erythraea NRRL 2338]